MTGKRRTRSTPAASEAPARASAAAKASTTPKSSSQRRKKQKQHDDIETSSPANESNHDEIVKHITKFVSATKSSSSEKGNSDDNDDLTSVISYLIQVLQNNNTSAAAVDGNNGEQQHGEAMYITNEDVATLLLPWSVGRLMRLAAAPSTSNTTTTDDFNGLAWAALSCSLDIITATSSSTATPSNNNSTSNETLLSSCFPQSTLNRLVPYAAQMTFSSSSIQLPSAEGTNYNISNSASTAFVHLVRRYKSPLDVVCKTLLCEVDSLLLNNNPTAGNDTTTTTSCLPHEQQVVAIVVHATLETIYRLFENANPKRLFAIVSSTDVLPRLGRLSMVLRSSDGEKLIQNILWEGLFNPFHHMDGFRTTSEMKIVPKLSVAAAAAAAEKDGGREKEDKKGGNKTCFQAGLFQSVRTLLSSVEDDNGRDIIATAKLLPSIVHGFFERIRQHAMQKNKNGGSNTTTEMDAKLQLRFWCHLMLPVLESLFGKNKKDQRSGDVDNALLEAISQTLGLVLQYDAYLPSYNDPDEEHLTYLQSVANGLVRCVDDDSSNKRTTDHDSSYALVTSLCNLILLNHRLLHGQLSTVTYYTCSCLPQKNQEPNKLLFTIVKTYRELRAIGDFLTATRDAFTTKISSSQEESANTMTNIFQCNNVVDSLALAYQSCPSGQLQEIWNFFDGWIVDSINEASELSFAVQMFIIFVKSIRSDKQNSLGLRGLCELSMNSSIAKLLGSSDIESSIHMRLGFDLCGWLVELHSRTCFWVDNVSLDGESSFLLSTSEDDDTNRLNVLTYLHNAAETAVASDNFSAWKKSFLQMYWQKDGGFDSKVDIGVHPSLRGSLQRLALHRIHQLHSMIYYCNVEENDNDSNDSQSAVLTREAKMLVDFSFYIACSGAIGTPGSQSELEDRTLSTDSLWIPIAQSFPIWSHYSEHYHSELFLIWFYMSISSATSLRNSSYSSRREYATAIALTRDASFYDNDKIMSPLMHVGVKFAMHKNNDAVEAKSNTLSFISSAPVEFVERSDSTKILGAILDIDIQTTSSLRRSQDEKLATQALCSTRTILARVLSVAMLPSGVDTSLFIKMTRHLLSSFSNDDVACDMNYWAASSDAINEYLSLCLDYYEKEDTLLQDFFSQVLTLIHGDGPSSEITSSKAFILRGVIRKLNTLSRHHSLAKRSVKRNQSVYDVCAENVVAIHERTWTGLFSKISEANSSSCAELLLASELLSFHSNYPVKNEEVKENTTELFEELVNIRNSSPEADMVAACNYFLSLMAAVPDYLFDCATQEKVFEQILDAMSSSSPFQADTPLLDAAFCSLIRHTDVEGLNTAITILIQNEGKGQSSVFPTKTFHLMISSIKSQEQQKYIAEYCEHFLLISMNLLRDQGCDVREARYNVSLFSRMVTTLLAKKELLVLSGREIGMICSEMAPLFHIDRVNARDVECDISVYHSCTTVVSALIAHYSKQLYGCPSPLFGLLLSLLHHTLHTSTKKGLSEKALEFSKLCELLIPHKDIFKKHVVGLILCYIKALSEGMNPVTKKKLMPSIYALLDVCTDFETRQINAMIDVQSKTLFAPVFKSYQKFYQYHGQA